MNTDDCFRYGTKTKTIQNLWNSYQNSGIALLPSKIEVNDQQAIVESIMMELPLSPVLLHTDPEPYDQDSYTPVGNTELEAVFAFICHKFTVNVDGKDFLYDDLPKSEQDHLMAQEVQVVITKANCPASIREDVEVRMGRRVRAS